MYIYGSDTALMAALSPKQRVELAIHINKELKD